MLKSVLVELSVCPCSFIKAFCCLLLKFIMTSCETEYTSLRFDCISYSFQDQKAILFQFKINVRQCYIQKTSERQRIRERDYQRFLLLCHNHIEKVPVSVRFLFNPDCSNKPPQQLVVIASQDTRWRREGCHQVWRWQSGGCRCN